MDTLESTYRERLGEWTGARRVARSISLLGEVCAMLRRMVEASDPALDEREVRIRVAECLYRTDPETMRLLSLLRR
jgi:hypothetical protein